MSPPVARTAKVLTNAEIALIVRAVEADAPWSSDHVSTDEHVQPDDHAPVADAMPSPLDVLRNRWRAIAASELDDVTGLSDITAGHGEQLTEVDFTIDEATLVIALLEHLAFALTREDDGSVGFAHERKTALAALALAARIRGGPDGPIA
jgi:hypothetical protein